MILKFNGVPQHLSIPFAAMTRFVDPSVNFGLSFERSDKATGQDVVAPAAAEEPAHPPEVAKRASGDQGAGTVVNIDAFRRK